TLNEVKEDFDVIIDFSNASGLEDLLAFAKKTGKGVIVSTTGHTPEQKELMKEASKEIPVFFSANMSLGINLLID
ncbi:MAG: 4-hydroxy-tetrahydrodipicolinate reductase, partial [Clostridia bacterium]|nr:4-hydroxy-tetrahydrodipicolinate reductase [Clostridia bacterium]